MCFSHTIIVSFLLKVGGVMDFLNDILTYHPIIPYVVLIVGFVALIKGADWFVDGASSVAKKLGIPSVIIGLTIVAMGTSAPEAAVSISAALENNNGIALGNVIGSNIFNLLVVLGVCMLITRVPTKKDIISRDFPWNMMATIVVIICILDGRISRLEGVLLLAMFAAYIAYLVYSAIKSRAPADESEIGNYSWIISILLLIVGVVLIVAGGTCVVDSAKLIAISWGVDEILVGLTIVACGTSLPELVTSIVAAKKGECDMAVGNVIGSNIFNLLFILGTTTTITPIRNIDLSTILVDSVLLLGFTQLMLVFSQKESRFQKHQGAASVMCYVVYLAYIILRQFTTIF